MIVPRGYVEDGVTTDQFVDYLWKHWTTIQAQLRAGTTYPPHPIRGVAEYKMVRTIKYSGWSEVGEFFPPALCLSKALRFHVEGDTFPVDEMAVMRPIPDPLEATRELLKCKRGTFVYHTGKPEMVPYVGVRSGPFENYFG